MVWQFCILLVLVGYAFSLWQTGIYYIIIYLANEDSVDIHSVVNGKQTYETMRSVSVVLAIHSSWCWICSSYLDMWVFFYSRYKQIIFSIYTINTRTRSRGDDWIAALRWWSEGKHKRPKKPLERNGSKWKKESDWSIGCVVQCTERINNRMFFFMVMVKISTIRNQLKSFSMIVSLV